MKQDSDEEVAYLNQVVDDLQYRVVDNMVVAMASQIEAISAAFSPGGNMDMEAQAAAFTTLDKLVAEIMVRAMGPIDKDERHQRWLGQHVIGIKRQLAAMAADREVEHATVEKSLRNALGARSQ